MKPIAFYLPQFHPVEENNQWWGEGFTEWTNVTKAQPLFRGHNQPRFPADLGYYDLRLPEVRERQAEIAKENGVYGFCYYHYWFGNGKQLLERPLNEVLNLGKPDLPFCLCWANQSWTGIWFGAKNKVLMEQSYPGIDDYKAHFNYLRKAFEDPRYIQVDGKPLFVIYDVRDLVNAKETADILKELAVQAGFKGLHLLAGNISKDDWNPGEHNFDGKISNAFNKSIIGEQERLRKNSIAKKLVRNSYWELDFIKSKHRLNIMDHREVVRNMDYGNFEYYNYPIVVPNWDNTPRSGSRGLILEHSTPELFGKQILKAKEYLTQRTLEQDIYFVKSWNEWAEGNYLEPDTITGYEYLKKIKTIR